MNNIKCKICNSSESIRSMAMHLRWQHDMKTEVYVKEYGEFRPKNIKIHNIKKTSEISCLICNKKMMNNRQLMHHLTKEHNNISKEEYVLKYYYNNIRPLCKCGCGNPTPFYMYSKSITNPFYGDYIKGHWDWIKPGYNTHSQITKDIMSEKAKIRIKQEIEHQGYSNIHNPELLKERRITRKDVFISRIENINNVSIINKNEIQTVSSCNIFNYRCNVCFNMWSQKTYIPRCIKCNPYDFSKTSKEEKEILDFIYSIYPREKIITNTRTIIPPHEIDIFLPELNIGIEYNGLYWHSEIYKPNKNYHYKKFMDSQNNNIKLIQIFSDEWINKKEIVKSRIKNLIGVNENKIYARKCIIKEVNSKDKNKFLNINHIQGEDRSKIKLGLYYNNVLVSIMTFGNPRKAIGKINKVEENTFELIRFCSELNTNVVGGASRLLKYFIKHYNPNKIYSFADNRWSSFNSVYTKLGFILKNKSLPGYWYTKNFTERIHRYNFNKNKLKKMGFEINKNTEHEIMNMLKYYKVWDCGVSRYELS